METWREKPSDERDIVTTEQYRPPLARIAWERFRTLARMCDPEADVSEVVFKDGRRVLLAAWKDQDGRECFDIVKLDQALAYSHGGHYLFVAGLASLERTHEREVKPPKLTHSGDDMSIHDGAIGDCPDVACQQRASAG